MAYRQDVPLQFDDVELLFAALTPFEQGLATLRGTPLPTTCPEGVPAASTLTHCGQLGGFGLDQKVQGWDLYDTYQAQFTATKTFANILKASQMVHRGRSGRHAHPGHAGQAHRRPERPRPALQRPGAPMSAATTSCAAGTARRCRRRTASR